MAGNHNLKKETGENQYDINGNLKTVGGSGDNTIGRVKITDGTDVADVLDLNNSNPLAIAVVDGNGDQITAFGAGTQYTEDAAAAANPVGTVPILVRKDTPSASVSADGDNIAQRGTDFGAAYVTLLDASGNPVAVSGGTQYTEDVAAAADPVGTALNLIRKDTLAGLTSADGDNVAARGTDKGELYVKHVDTLPISAAALPLPSGAATSAKQDTQITAEQAIQTSVELIDDTVKADDAAFTPGTTKVVMSGFEFDDTAPDSVDEGDAGAARMSANRNQYMQIRDAAGNERGVNVSAGNALIVDGSASTQPVSGTVTATIAAGAATIAKAEDAASANADVGVPAMAIQLATPADTAGTDGDYAMLQMSAGRLWTSAKIDTALPAGNNNIGDVDVASSALPTGAATSAKQDTQITAEQAIQTSVELIDDAIKADDAAFTPATTKVMMAGFEFDDTAPDSVDEGDAGAARMSARREIYTQIRDAAGNERGANVTAGGALQTDGSATTQPISAASLPLPSGAATAALQTQPGVDIGDVTVNNASGASAVNIQDGGNSITVDGTITANLAAGTNNIGDVDVASIAAGDNNIGNVDIVTLPGDVEADIDQIRDQIDLITPDIEEIRVDADAIRVGVEIMDDWDNAASDGVSVSGDVAHDAADAGEPVKIGGKAITALPSAVADADRVNGVFDKFGRQVVLSGTIRDLRGTQTTTISASTSETTIVTAASSIFNDLIMVVVSNTSATAVRLDFRDTTGGSVIFSLYAPAGQAVGFSVPGTAVPQTSVNTNWTAQSSASVTDLRIFALFEKNK